MHPRSFIRFWLWPADSIANTDLYANRKCSNPIAHTFRNGASYFNSYAAVCVGSEIRLFADDYICYREIRDTEDSLKLQKAIDRLGCWARKSGMRFQPVK